MALRTYDLVLAVRATNYTGSALRSVTNDLRKLGAETSLLNQRENLHTRLMNVQSKMKGATAKQTARLTAQEAILQQRIAQVSKEIRMQPWVKLSAAGSIMRDVGRTARLFGIGTAGAIAGAALAYSKFNQETTFTATQMGQVGRSFQQVIKDGKQMETVILNTMRNSTSSSQDLNAAAYDLFSSLNTAGKGFLTASEGAKLLKLSSDAAIAGMTDIATSTNGAIAVMNAFSIPANQMDEVMNRLFAAVRFGRMTFGEFAATLSVTAPAAKAAGQSLDTLAGTMAFLTRRLDVRKASIGFARLLEILSRGKFVSGLKKAGVEITNAQGQLLQLPEIIKRIVGSFPELQKGGILLTNFFKAMSGTEGTIQARRAFVFLAQQLGDYRDILASVTRDNNEFNKSLAAMNQTLGVRWGKMVNRIKASILELGRDTIPVIEEVTKPLQDAFHWFERLDPAVKKTAASYAVWASAILLVGGTIGSLVGGLANLVGLLGRTKLLLPTVIASVVLLGTKVTGATGLVDGLTRSLGALGAGLSNIADSFGSLGATDMALLSGVLTVLTARMVAANDGFARLRQGLGATQGRVSRFRQTLQAAATQGLILFPGMTVAQKGFNTQVSKGGVVVRNLNQHASRLPKFFAVAGTAAAAIPKPLAIAAGLVGVGTAATLLWHHHMENVRKEAERIDEALAPLTAKMAFLAKQRIQFGRVADSIIGLQQARATAASLTLQIADLQKEVDSTKGARKPLLQAQLAGLKAELRDAELAVKRFQRVVFRGFEGIGPALRGLLFPGQDIAKAEAAVTRIKDRIAELTALQAQEMNKRIWRNRQMEISDLNDKLAVAEERVKRLNAESAKSPGRLAAQFQKIRDIINVVAGDLLPNLPQELVRRVATAISLTQGTLNQKQLIALIKALVDPKSLAAADAQLQALVMRTRVANIEVAFRGALMNPLDPQAWKNLAAAAGELPVELNKIKPLIDGLGGKGTARKVNDLLKALGLDPSGGADKDFKLPINLELAETNARLSESKSAIRAALRAQEAYIENQMKLTKDKKKLNELGQALLDVRDAMDSLDKETTETSKAVDEFKQKLETATQTLQSTFNTALEQSKAAFGGLADSKFFKEGIGAIKLDWGIALKPEDLQTSLQEQVDAFEKWRDAIGKIGKNVPQTLLDAIQALGPEQGTLFAEAITQMSPAQRKKYIALWNRGQQDVQKAAQQDFQKQLARWRRLGKKIIQAILGGMSEEDAKLADYFENLAKVMLAAAGDMKGGGGGGSGKGKSKGAGKPTKPKSRGTQSRGTANMGREAGRQTQGIVNYNQTVHAHHSESLDTVMRRAHFRFRHRVAGK